MKTPSQPLRPRTLAEELLYIECHPCDCGERALDSASSLILRDGHMMDVRTGKCGACGRERSFEFVAPATPQWRDEVGLGAGSSNILDPEEILAASDRLAKSVKSDDGPSLPADQRAAWHVAMRRAAAYVADVVASTPDGAQKDRLAARLWEYRLSVARLKPRRDPSSFPTVFRGTTLAVINRAAGDAHKAWLKRGRVGEGRFVAQEANLADAPIGPAELTAARFVRCKLTRAKLGMAKLREVEMIDCLCDEAVFAQALSEDAWIRNSVFMNADLRMVLWQRCRIHGAEMSQARLDRARFDDGEVEDVRFDSALVRDATFDRAIVVDCDFRNADLSLAEPRLKLCSMRNAAFIRCDFRGTKWDGRRVGGTLFEDCQFDGATGTPTIESPNQVVRADVKFLG